MQLLKDRIRKDGKVKEGNVLKVDSFLNHQMDIRLFREIGKEFKRRFEGTKINKILTIEASGIGIACIVAEEFDVPVVFAKKTQTKNIAGEVYRSQVESYTHGRIYDIIVSKEFLGKGDKVLLIDDFLANGKALEGLIDLVQAAGAEVVGAGIVIEKGLPAGRRHHPRQGHTSGVTGDRGEYGRQDRRDYIPGEMIRREGAVFSWRSFLLCMGKDLYESAGDGGFDL